MIVPGVAAEPNKAMLAVLFDQLPPFQSADVVFQEASPVPLVQVKVAALADALEQQTKPQCREREGQLDGCHGTREAG